MEEYNLFFIKEKSIGVEWWSSVDSLFLWNMLDIHCFVCKFENLFRYQSFLSDWNANYTVSWENKKRHIRNGDSVNTFVHILEGVFSLYSSRCSWLMQAIWRRDCRWMKWVLQRKAAELYPSIIGHNAWNLQEVLSFVPVCKVPYCILGETNFDDLEGVAEGNRLKILCCSKVSFKVWGISMRNVKLCVYTLWTCHVIVIWRDIPSN